MNVSISSILILNTIAHTYGASGVGAEAAKLFGMEYMFYISAILTLLILFLSEILPKTIGAVYYKQLAPYTAYAINVFIFITYPLIKVSLFVTQKISHGTYSDKLTREELLETTLLSEDAGIIDERESDYIENVLRFNKSRICEILTPRSVVFALNAHQKICEVLEMSGIQRFSRIPVYDGTIDNIVGVVLSKRIFERAIKNDSDEISSLMQPVFLIHENIPVSFALDLFIKRKEHMFVVTDSYGQTEGIVTLEDCIETLLGVEIMDELDTTEDMRKLAKDKMRKKKKKKELENSDISAEKLQKQHKTQKSQIIG
ncbi:MAG: CNNM domain-containing protein [Sulfurospirillaceae bacterium]|nr:CNNM domain-containing protein [Sulfurospirillaceae bacterium]